ncbi:hypothetical protein WJX74_004523 [Apatococcus lobatus]|uniref:Chromosome partition protein Smc n=2 Tax=Apatococcus TaxID=904362 RepID=A0AAW1T7M1_9CHLO
MEIVKKLDFGDISLHEPRTEHLRVQEVIQAVAEPSVARLAQAFDYLQASAHPRFVRVQQLARERAGSSSEGDLTRLERQFSSLKNTFIHYDVKDCFLEALQLGFPNGLEDQSLRMAEAELAEAQEQLKFQKRQNDQAQSNLFELTSHLAAAYAAFEQQHKASQDRLAEAAALEQDIAQQEQALSHVASRSHEDSIEAEARARLSSEATHGQQLEAQISAVEAEVAALRSASAAEKEEVRLLQAQVQSLAAVQSISQRDTALHEQAAVALHRHEQLIELHAAVGHVRILGVGANVLQLQLAIPCQQASGNVMHEHALTITFMAGAMDVKALTLSDVDLDLEPVQRAAVMSDDSSLAYVVAEVRELLIQYYSSRTIPGSAGT